MPRKHIAVLSLLVVVPLLALSAMARRLVQSDQVRNQQQFEALLEANLSGIDRTITAYFDAVEQRLLNQDLNLSNLDSIRAFTRSEPLVEQVVLLGADGDLIYPDPRNPLSRQETEYLLKIEPLINDRSLIRRREEEFVDVRIGGGNGATSNDRVMLRNQPIDVTMQHSTELGNGRPKSLHRDYGWYPWYWGNGIQLIHWQSRGDGRTLVIGLQRARWMADIIATLPDSNPASLNRAAPAQIRLVNAEGEPVYLWGAQARFPRDAQPVSTLHLSSPLRPWQLQHFGPSRPFRLEQSAKLVSLIASGGVLSAALIGLAVYLSREIGRQTREARQRVSFVNQVSHELKTPLTNIRMYADLLDQDLKRIDPDDARAQTHLDVIASESGRLSRLINNVLSLARLQHDRTHRAQEARVDDVIRQVIDQFSPSLESLGIEVTLNLDASLSVGLDVDALEQMLGNLISNVEKYAADGRHIRVASRQKHDRTVIDISDAGPGVTPEFAKRIFQPFERASDSIVSATGTGIGLTITRDLARRNGGDLELLESTLGASFRLSLRTPFVKDSGEPSK